MAEEEKGKYTISLACQKTSIEMTIKILINNKWNNLT